MSPGCGSGPIALVLSVLVCLRHLSATSELQNSTQYERPSMNSTQFEHPKHPCMPSAAHHAYKTFLKRHLTPDQPQSLDQNQWQKFIKNHNLCDRPTQSFLRPETKEQVLAVCSSNGGRTFLDNLCISEQEFSFVTVRLIKHSCDIRGIIEETKHLILACDAIDNMCRPVHFQGNPEDLKPDKNQQPPCIRPQKSQAVRITVSWAGVVLPLSLLWPLWN